MENTKVIKIKKTLVKYIHNVYEAKLIISETSAGISIKPTMKNELVCQKFSKPETGTDPKIYAILLPDNTLLYIGQTKQSLSSRFRMGLNPQHQTGYHGYKWKNNAKIKIHCYTIPSCDKEEIESIEAEMVYNHRESTGNWPFHQTEIHFYNNEDTKELAKYLYKELWKINAPNGE
jgi:gamma-glutamylcyclotransferase (GGCT)/AIG2-like uncharacterized protein YtfP